ncbi:DUF340 domain-containing protein [Treponema phagedenis]|uniref:DUF340 domain-containing protein n=1 Tax=Treponema phagedenis TaxID=162 RepID=A0A0B7GV54_TREPH|nr:hypothetical protein [Treponema phagedenis]EFW38119.1 hypothetical protein HMPREF9554_01368 [Treponema phagedenis F0421]NVP24524.1 DUF340 domain-containing protein [Treponema phagedenis]QEJ94781.1 DUF340 domain-containing protein [Treponema phagedenis]QEJ97717.1 DUF340 domain-containing protein [Treponema phagedenis]QEK00687.1 DUF340 domain-containing protein [Treponema phagedenis]
MKFKDQIIVLLITSVISVIANWIGPKISPLLGIPGVVILALLCVAGILLAKVIPGKIPAVAYIVTIATIMTIPGVPFSEHISYYTSKVNFTTLCTPILAYAGIYTGANLEGLKKTGPRIVLLAVLVILGTYVGSALIAEVILKMLGQI